MPTAPAGELEEKGESLGISWISHIFLLKLQDSDILPLLAFASHSSLEKIVSVLRKRGKKLNEGLTYTLSEF